MFIMVHSFSFSLNGMGWTWWWIIHFFHIWCKTKTRKNHSVMDFSWFLFCSIIHLYRHHCVWMTSVFIEILWYNVLFTTPSIYIPYHTIFPPWWWAAIACWCTIFRSCIWFFLFFFTFSINRIVFLYDFHTSSFFIFYIIHLDDKSHGFCLHTIYFAVLSFSTVFV